MSREDFGRGRGSRVYGERRDGNVDLANTAEPPRAREHRGAAPAPREQPYGDCAWATGQGPSPHARGNDRLPPAPLATNSRAQ